jgi:phosphate transport system substrate-binding protein
MTLGPVRCLSLLLMLCSLLFTSLGWAGEAVRLKGSGASFPFPLYGLWFKEYGKANRNIIIDYQAKGSGAGITERCIQNLNF